VRWRFRSTAERGCHAPKQPSLSTITLHDPVPSARICTGGTVSGHILVSAEFERNRTVVLL
jgi:hypothetical protein